jgi:hypothetical protein
MEASFEKLLVLLAEAEVRFIVVGGVAVTLHGYVRLTEDVDILIDSAPDNVAALLQALSHYGEGFARELRVDDFTDEEGAIRVVEEVEQCQIDIFTVMSGLHYADVIHSADRHVVRGHSIPYASKAHLIGWKAHSVREKDHLDASALRQLSANPHAFD